jgi:hypothetical protein
MTPATQARHSTDQQQGGRGWLGYEEVVEHHIVIGVSYGKATAVEIHPAVDEIAELPGDAAVRVEDDRGEVGVGEEYLFSIDEQRSTGIT